MPGRGSLTGVPGVARSPLEAIGRACTPVVCFAGDVCQRGGKTPFVAAAQVSAEGRPERLRLSPVQGYRTYRTSNCPRFYSHPSH